MARRNKDEEMIDENDADIEVEGDEADDEMDEQELAEATKALAEKKAKRDAKKAAMTEARARVLASLEASPEAYDEQFKADVKMLLAKATRTVGTPRTTLNVNTAIRNALVEAGEQGLSEMDIFKMFKIGRPEMSIKRRMLVLCKNPEDRVWFVFDDKAEVYRVVSKGPNPPEGWDGYIPADKESL